ncbi:MAG: NAD(P)-dependent oxidoreductase [Candidatus Mariimomonas ferrooxydans]
MKVLITGATGFIGSHLAERLLKKGHEVACLTRKVFNPGWLEGLDIKFIEGDCSDKDSISNCLSGYDYVFHLSGLTKTNLKDDFYTVNTRGTENIINMIVKKNPTIKRFVYLSSLAAFGPKVNDNMPIEDQEPRPVSDYGTSKLNGENAVLKYSDTIPITILRPSAVYGPRDRHMFLLFKYIKRGFLPYPGEGCTSLIYVDDLIDAIILTGEKENAIGKIYFISDGVIYSNEEIIKEIANVLNVRPLKIKLPRTVLSTIGFFSEKISTIIGESAIINRDKIKELSYKDWVCDITKAKNDLCFKPEIGIKEGIKWTADWYKIHKWL